MNFNISFDILTREPFNFMSIFKWYLNFEISGEICVGQPLNMGELLNYWWLFELLVIFFYIIISGFGCFLDMIKLLNSVGTFKIYVNCWIISEVLNNIWTYKSSENFWTIGDFFSDGWTFELCVNFLFMGKILSNGWAFEIWVTFLIMCDILNHAWTFELLVNFLLIHDIQSISPLRGPLVSVCRCVRLSVCPSVHFWGTVKMYFCPHFLKLDVQYF